MLLVDTNVLVDVLQDDPMWADWSEHQLRVQSQVHELLINPVMPKPALFLASRAFVKYRRGGGTKTNVLADFFIGAHAAVLNCGILTRDGRRYRNHFPRVALVVPDTKNPH
ncbi:MAG: DNA-binding protein [Proteobacteria bacterium]|nr:DNA-binding protein [Pseudomonadota bacterium]